MKSVRYTQVTTGEDFGLTAEDLMRALVRLLPRTAASTIPTCSSTSSMRARWRT